MAGCNKARGLNKPKMKTKRSTAKRFTVTASGLIKHGAKGKRHCLSNKGRKRKRQLLRAGYLTHGNAGLLERAIPYLG